MAFFEKNKDSDMQIPKSEKKIIGPPPLPNPGDAPVVIRLNVMY